MVKLQNLLLLVTTFLFILFLNLGTSEKGWVSAKTSQEALHQQAQNLTQSGQESLDRGDTIAALKDWQEATKIYRHLKYQEGVAGSLINQSLAYQQVGFNLKACSTLLESLNLNTGWLCNFALTQAPSDPKQALSVAITRLDPSQINALGLQKLGEVLWLIGKTEESELVLLKALKISQITNFALNIDNVKLSLGNVQRAVFNQLRDKYADIGNLGQKEDPIQLIQEKIALSSQLYQQLNQTSHSNTIRLQAELNLLAELIDAEKWALQQIKEGESELSNYHSQIIAQIKPLIAQIQQNSTAFSQLSPSQSVLARLNFATSLSQVANRQWQDLGLQYADSALQIAQGLNNSRLQSNSLGVIGKLALLQQNSKAQSYFENALALAEATQAWNLAWQWQYYLGKIYQKQGNQDQAIQAYSSALDHLNLVRSNLLAITPDIQYSFRDQVEPLYRELMRLLLLTPSPDHLKQVTNVNEQLQLAELENFLRCGRLDLIPLNQLQNVTDKPAVIYLIDLSDTIAVIVQSKDGSLHLHTPNLESVRNNISNLINEFQNQKFVYTGSHERYVNVEVEDLLPFSQELYKQLISPIKSYLPPSGTLIFVLDSSFQNLPLGILHDGQRYLVEKYSFALTLNSQLRQPKALRKNQLRALVAGLSAENPPSFNEPNIPRGLGPLPETIAEIENIQQAISTSVLLNQNFTTGQLQREISQSIFPIIHISTHGEFSSDPDQTFILDWDQALDVRQFYGLLNAGNREQTIELLVLSACESAQGDKRSALGLAGVATQAGARSTVASLWLVDANSTALLMGSFYDGLKAGLSKAEALRQAQLSLISNPKYAHPFYWAPFVLVGSWL